MAKARPVQLNDFILLRTAKQYKSGRYKHNGRNEGDNYTDGNDETKFPHNGDIRHKERQESYGCG